LAKGVLLNSIALIFVNKRSIVGWEPSITRLRGVNV